LSVLLIDGDAALTDTDQLRHQIPAPDIIATDLYSIDWRNNQARCPRGDRHQNGDKNPSLRYDKTKQRIFCASQNCFGQKGVDAFGFVMEMEGCDFPGSVRLLQTRYGAMGGNGHHAALPPKSRQLAADVRAWQVKNGYQVVAEFLFGDGLRKVRLEHTSKIQASKPRPEKTFFWEHYAADGLWYSGDGGKPKPLYVNSIFHERDQPGQAIGFEGEHKADIAGTLGFAAFSYREMTQKAAAALADWGVVLWPDADPAGANNAKKAAQLISKAGARTVAIATPPPEMPNSGDIVDAVQSVTLAR
jgi:hypothetical protein